MKTTEAIQNRRTQKVLADNNWSTRDEDRIRESVTDLLRLAARAPYHTPVHPSHTEGGGSELTSTVPWRFYCLTARACRETASYMQAVGLNPRKLGNMLNAADTLLLVTWLPDPPTVEMLSHNSIPDPSEAVPFEGNLRNMEHIAAASAAIQNVLLGATAAGIPNYWSSGGLLRNANLRERLGVPLKEVLLGAVFLFPPDSEQREGTILTGKMREQGKELNSWSKWIGGSQ